MLTSLVESLREDDTRPALAGSATRGDLARLLRAYARGLQNEGLTAGDTLVLCSDGLSRMVTDPEIGGILLAEPDAAKAADRLVSLANEYGGADNVTVIVIRLVAEEKAWFSWLRRGSQKSASGSNGSAGGL